MNVDSFVKLNALIFTEMSWFYHVSQGSNEQQPQLSDTFTPAVASPFSSLAGSTQETLGNARLEWPSSYSPPGLLTLPSPPQCSAPPTLESLSCASHNAVPGGGSLPVSYVTLQEYRCVMSWFLGWTSPQRERFLQDLLGKAVPGKVCTLLDSLNTLQVLVHPVCVCVCVCVCLCVSQPC
jgi:hypothetical protein